MKKPGCKLFRPKRGWADSCAECNWSRAAHTKKALAAVLYQESVAIMTKPRLPSGYRSGQVLVPVRAYFRRQKGYLNRAPKKGRSAIAEFLAGFARGLTK